MKRTILLATLTLGAVFPVFAKGPDIGTIGASPQSIGDSGLAWYTTWDTAMAEAKRSQQAAAAAAFRAELGGVERGIEHAETGLAAMGLKTSGEDRFLIDIKTGEQIFVERDGGRKYRLGSNGGKLYEDEKPKKKCDLPTTFRHLPTTSPP